MKSIQKSITEKTVPAKITETTYKNLKELQALLVAEKRMINPTLIQATDLAVQEAVQRIRRRRERRQTQEATA